MRCILGCAFSAALCVSLSISAHADEWASGTITTNDGVRLHYVEAGSGRPLLLLPGWSQSAAEFKHQLDGLSDSYRVIALDFRGHGLSDKPEHGYRISRLAKDLDDALTAFDLTDVAVGGHSMGSSVIWSYIDLFGTDRLSHVIVIDQAPLVVGKPGLEEGDTTTYGVLWPEYAQLAGFYSAVVGTTETGPTADLLQGMFTPAFPRDDLEWIADENLQFPRLPAADLVYNHTLQDWRDLIPRIDVPTLVVGGRNSIFSAESQEWIASQIPGARVEIFEPDEGGSHFMFFENHERFNEIVREFLG